MRQVDDRGPSRRESFQQTGRCPDRGQGLLDFLHHVASLKKYGQSNKDRA